MGSYIQTMLRRTEGSSKEEQIIQKEQILAELQRVEKELQEKAHAQQQLPAKRDEPIGMEDPGAAPPFSFQLPDQPPPPETGPGIQGMAGLSIPPGRSLANIPPSERPKAKPSRKMIDGKGAKQKSQLQAALQQHSQQLAQLQQLQQLKQQVQQQRQLKQQNQQTLAALQQNAIANQQQLAALQQKLQLQQQIKQFQQQVEQQLAYTQHAGPVPPPPLPQAPPPGKKPVNGAPASEGSGGGEEEAGASYVELGQGGQEVQTTDLNFLMCGEQLQFDQQGFMAVGPGGVPAGIDPSILTSAAFELVQASQALQAVQAVQPLLASESPPLMTPLTQVTLLLLLLTLLINFSTTKTMKYETHLLARTP